MLIDLNRFLVRLKYDCAHYHLHKDTKAITKMQEKLILMGQDLDHLDHNVKFYRGLINALLESDELKNALNNDKPAEQINIEEEDAAKALGKAFMIARESALYSIEEAANLTHSSQATIIRLEAGYDSSTICFLREYAQKLGYHLQILLVP